MIVLYMGHKGSIITKPFLFFNMRHKIGAHDQVPFLALGE